MDSWVSIDASVLIRHEAHMSARHIVPHFARNESRPFETSANLETHLIRQPRPVTFDNGLFDNQKMNCVFT